MSNFIVVKIRDLITVPAPVLTFPIFSAPWTLAGNLYGIENLIMATIENADFVHEFLRRIIDDFHMPMFKALNENIPGFTEMDFVDVSFV